MAVRSLSHGKWGRAALDSLGFCPLNCHSTCLPLISWMVWCLDRWCHQSEWKDKVEPPWLLNHCPSGSNGCMLNIAVLLCMEEDVRVRMAPIGGHLAKVGGRTAWSCGQMELSPVCQVGPIYSYFACVSSIWAPTINICNKTRGTMLVARVRVVCVKCDLSFLLFSEYWWSKWWFIDRQHAPKLRLLLILEEKLGLRAEWIRGCCDVTIKQSLLVIKHIKFTLSSGNRSALFKTVVHLLPCFHL